MNLKPEQLAAHLQQGLQSLYLVQGDEPLQHMECADSIRKAAQQAGYLSREVFYPEKGFDWSELIMGTQSMSLFSELRLIELRLGNGKIGDAGSKAILQLLDDPPQDTLLLILLDKPERSVSNSKWFKRLKTDAVMITVWPLKIEQFPAWLRARAGALGFSLDPDAAQLLAQRSEGNLLAASQELEKIALLALSDSGLDLGAGQQNRVSADALWRIVADNARYDIFSLGDAALAGDATRAKRILSGLRAEAMEPVLILWAVSREIRGLLQMALKLGRGMALNQVLTQAGVWAQRKPVLGKALNRLSSQQLEQMLSDCCDVDKMIKGLRSGSVWDELQRLLMGLAGISVPLSKLN